jgi:hypothetical protein
MFEGYFALQLTFARQYATAASVPFDIAVARCTNLRRRLNLTEAADAPRWNDLLARVGCLMEDQPAALALCLEVFETRPRHEPPRTFGCFSCDPPDESGVLRLHFMPPADVRASPLAFAGIDARLNELRALFAHVRRTERNAASVRGISWLYNLDAYKRLFPPSYRTSVQAPRFPLRMTGSSTWGQVLNWRQEVKPAARDAVLAGLDGMKIEAPWEVFPLSALTATCGIDPFHDWFS